MRMVNIKILAALCVFSGAFTVFAASIPENNNSQNSLLHLSVVNASGQNLCIQDEITTHCSQGSNQEFTVQPQYFYERGGVIRVSIGNHPLKIAMLKKGVKDVDLYVDNSGKMHAPTGAFEKGSLVYSDNRDYLYFVAKPNALFSEYPVG